MAITQIIFENIEILREDKTKGVFEFIAEINSSFPRIPKGRNPRSVDPTRKRYRDIVDALKTNSNFEDANRGFLMTATDIIPDKSGNRIAVTLNDAKKEGHFDGGHTEHAIRAVLPLIDSLERRVRVRIYVGTLSDSEVERLSYSNNNIKPQEERNHANLEGAFDNLKKGLGSLVQNVSFFDGDVGDYRVEDIIGLEIAATGNFAIKFFEEFSGRSKRVLSLREFYRKGATQKVKWHVARQSVLNKLCIGTKPVIYEVGLLWDYILENSEALYDASTRKSSYSRLRLHENPLSSKNVLTTTLARNVVSNALPAVMITMILEGILRHELVLTSSRGVQWRGALTDAKARYAKEARDIIKFLNDKWLGWSKSGGSGRDFSEDAAVWAEVYQRLQT